MVITAILSEQPFAAPIPRNGPPFAGIRRSSSRTLSATGRKPAHGPRLFRFPDARPSAWARLPSDHSSGCRFFNALQVRGQGRALNVFFLRAFAVDAQRWVRRILNPSRPSFKLRVLVDRQRPMKNVSLDRTTVLQLYTRRTDGALNAAADCTFWAITLPSIVARHRRPGDRKRATRLQFGRRPEPDHCIRSCRRSTCRGRCESPIPISSSLAPALTRPVQQLCVTAALSFP